MKQIISKIVLGAVAAAVLSVASSAFAAPTSATLGLRYTTEGRLTVTGTLNQNAGRGGCRVRLVAGIANVEDTTFDRKLTIGFRSLARGKKSFRFTLRDLPPVQKDENDNAPIMTMQLKTVCFGREAFISNAKAVFVDCGTASTAGSGANGEVSGAQFLRVLQRKVGDR